MGIKSILKKSEFSIDNYPEIFKKKGKIYSFLNPYGYHLMRQNINLFEKLDGIFFDGILLCVFYRLFYGKSITRKSFDMTTVAKDLFNHISKTGETIYFVGARKNEIAKSIANYKTYFPNLVIKGFRDGYFENEEEKISSMLEIIKLNPDFVVVGMGAIKQEDFAVKLKELGYQGIGFTCGGFIHQTSEDVNYFPKIINQLHLRSFYRLYKEKDTRKRIYNTFIQFPYLFIKDKLNLK